MDEEEIPYKVTQLPPNNLATDIQHETIYYNRQILKNYGDRTIKTNNLYERPNMIDSDRFHLNTNGLEEMAKAVGAAIKKGMKQDPKETKNQDKSKPYKQQPTSNITTQTIQLNHEIAGRVIGKEGIKVRKLRDDHSVAIGIKKDDKGGAQLTITGPKFNVAKAAEEVENTMETAKQNAERDARRELSREDRRKTQVCWNYKRGQCTFGTRCWYAHSNNPLDVSTRTTPERPNKRQRSDSRNDDKENTMPNTKRTHKERTPNLDWYNYSSPDIRTSYYQGGEPNQRTHPHHQQTRL